MKIISKPTKYLIRTMNKWSLVHNNNFNAKYKSGHQSERQIESCIFLIDDLRHQMTANSITHLN